MFDGFYQARFETPDARAFGVITLTKDNKLYGGNNEFMYVGRYTRRGDNFSADVEVKQLFGVKTSGHVFREGLKIQMTGRGLTQTILCVCESPDLPGVEMKATLERVLV
jgi:hypothetical protein